MRLLAALVLVGCGRDGNGTVAASCVQDPDNTLRLVCDVLTFPPGPVEVVVVDPVDGRQRVFTSSASADSHTVRVWGLHAESEIGWTARANGSAVSGSTLTGQVPAEFGEPPVIEISGDHRIETLMIPRTCAGSPGLAMVDDEGEFVWYADLGEATGGFGIIGFSLTRYGAVALVGREALVEVGFDGVLRQVLRFGEQLDRYVHHDAIVSPDGYTYVLTGAQDTDANGAAYVRDGIDVFDPSGDRVTAWQLGPPFDPTVGFPPPIGYWTAQFGFSIRDPSHANGLWFVDSSTVLMSLRHASAVVAVDGLRQNQGQIAWAVGSGSAVPTDFEWPDGQGFTFQHNPVLLGDGTFTVLDNKSFPGDSRALRFALDEGAGTATELESWSAARWCMVQGNASLLADDHMLIGCATTRQAIEVAGDGEIVWQLRNACDPLTDNGLARALPVVLGDVTQ